MLSLLSLLLSSLVLSLLVVLLLPPPSSSSVRLLLAMSTAMVCRSVHPGSTPADVSTYGLSPPAIR
eukprot:3676239-Alexandrium_andersonii.AAC.1